VWVAKLLVLRRSFAVHAEAYSGRAVGECREIVAEIK
jgi:hypothetical protein